MAKFIQSPETFFVEEINLFEPSNEGSHLFVTFSRKSMSTFFVANQLKKILKIKETEIGIAGNKDKLSTAIQTFSLPARLETKIIKAFEQIGAEILSCKLHNEKLRMGQILGNRFKVIFEVDSLKECEELNKKLKEIKEKGFPNFFGPQRVSDVNSIEEGKKLFLNKSLKKGDRRNRFTVSVFQSVIFNDYLKARIERNLYPEPIVGDVVKIGDNFCVLKEKVETSDFIEKIILTGPIIGSKMVLPFGESLVFEKSIVESFGISYEDIFLARAKGSRRCCVAKPKEIKLETISEKLLKLSFELPKGSYATTLLKHLGVELSLANEKDS